MPDSGTGCRRVTTGRDPRGNAIVLRDERVADDPRACVLWGADAAPVLDGAPPSHQGWWPPPGGVRVSLCQRAPDRNGSAIGARTPWPDIHDQGGFHQSDSVDIVVMLSGTVVLELDEDASVTLEAGDTLIQNGTRHRWRNETDQPATMVVIVVGARRA